MNTIELPAPVAVREITEKLEQAGYSTWAVGGAVRDILLGNRHTDWDLATRARPNEVRKLFKRTVPIGIEHGTVGVFGKDGVMYEVTTFRRDVETTGRHAVVEFADTLDEDLSRRDFTFNAIAWHPLTHELRDPFGGFEDLRAVRLQTVGAAKERFAEDYLRVLRALRFAGHYVLQIEPTTWQALTAATSQLHVLSAERVREELWKVLSKTRHASAALRLYASSGALRELYPELAALVSLEEETGTTVWTQTLAAVDALPPARPLLRVAALLHALGMPAARSRDLRGGWRFVGHESAGTRLAEAVLRRLKASNADTERVSRLIELQSELFPPDAPDSGVRRWLLRVPPSYVYDLFRLRFALQRAAGTTGGERDLVQRWRMAHRILLRHPVLDVSGLAIGGQDLKALGLSPGPQFSEILEALLLRVIEEPELNEPERLLAIVRKEYLA